MRALTQIIESPLDHFNCKTLISVKRHENNGLTIVTALKFHLVLARMAFIYLFKRKKAIESEAEFMREKLLASFVSFPRYFLFLFTVKLSLLSAVSSLCYLLFNIWRSHLSTFGLNGEIREWRSLRTGIRWMVTTMMPGYMMIHHVSGAWHQMLTICV